MFALAVGDLDGDSLEDVVLATETTSISTYLGQGDGVYTSSWGANVFVTIPDLALAHLSDDDHLDLVYAADTATDSVRVRLGLGNGQFGAELLADADHPQVTSIAVGRFDGDERIDVAYLGPAAKTLGLLFGQAAGTFSAGTALAVAENPRFIESADLSNDGYHDLIVAYEGTSLELFMSNGDRTFAEPLSIALGFVPDSLALGEANGDGVPDIILSNENSENIRVQLSTP
jgi:hypothetical protein